MKFSGTGKDLKMNIVLNTRIQLTLDVDGFVHFQPGEDGFTAANDGEWFGERCA